jgi:hypothetical protein
MKKIMMILVVLVQTTLFAQNNQIIEKPLELSSVAVGTLSDDVLLRGATDQEVKKITVNNLLISKANIDSPVFTGTPLVPTATVGTNTTQIASTAFVLANSPVTPDAATTVKGKIKLAGDLGGTADLPTTPTAVHLTGIETITGNKIFNTSANSVALSVNNSGTTASGIRVTNSSTGSGIFSYGLSGSTGDVFQGGNNTVPTFKVNKEGVVTALSFTKSGGTPNQFLKADGSVDNNTYAYLVSPIFTGTPTLPTGTIATTQTAGNNTTALATTAFVTTADNLKANLVSPIFTGTPTLPTGTIGVTQTAGNNTTALATTAFVKNQNPFKTFSITINQTGSNAPTTSLMQNDTGSTFSLTRNSTGLYTVTASSAVFYSGTTFIMIQNNQAVDTISVRYFRTSNTQIEIRTYLSGVLTDGLLVDCSLEIKLNY